MLLSGIRLCRADPAPLTLVAAAPSRRLPPGLISVSCSPLAERLLDDPAKLAAMERLRPAEFRFPGGSGSNFYDWRTGLYNYHEGPQSSTYVRDYLAVRGRQTAATHPGGAHFEDYYDRFVRPVGAKVILTPNLETSTVEEQVAWFRQLKREGILPTDIELGNEFWIAMGFDPESVRRWPDSPTALAVMHRYERALRPLVGPDAKFAVQSSASAYWVPATAQAWQLRRQLDWDARLKSENWFDAVTIHLQTGLALRAPGVAGPQRVDQLSGADTHAGMFRYLMAQADAGVDRVIADLARRLPGKEIWVTEWHPGGGSPEARTYQLTTPAMDAQGSTRQLLAFLRHPEITKTVFFTANFDYPHYSVFIRATDGSWQPDSQGLVLTWFANAANPGGSFQRVAERGGVPIEGDPQWENDFYMPIEGGVLKTGGRTTLILQNASGHDRRFDPSNGGHVPPPAQIDILATPNLDDGERRAASPRSVPGGELVLIPAFSIARFIWPGDVAVLPE